MILIADSTRVDHDLLGVDLELASGFGVDLEPSWLGVGVDVLPAWELWRRPRWRQGQALRVAYGQP